jgi:hypothetical protein
VGTKSSYVTRNSMNLTNYHAKYFAYDLTRRCASDSVEKLAAVLADAQVDLNSHELPVLTIPEAQKIMKTKYYPTAKKAIDMLVAAGIIEQFGEAKYGKVFIAMDILREIEKNRGSKG